MTGGALLLWLRVARDRTNGMHAHKKIYRSQEQVPLYKSGGGGTEALSPVIMRDVLLPLMLRNAYSGR
ncbi:MAG: hypothetical protein DSM106950_01455 [Stigonema ocellatum SAG 48.90 = DSM 106950]|nr:hypothetical protein [Stigonema ocellatum SAG 48.90 = DSM 106950]